MRTDHMYAAASKSYFADEINVISSECNILFAHSN